MKTAGNSGSHRGRSGGETPVPAPVEKQAAQSSGVNAAAAAPLSGQAAPSPAQQVFDVIKSAMPAAAEGEPATAAGNPSAPADYQPLKTITIAFQPDGLGTVAIQLSLKSSQFGVRLEASETSTAQILRQHGNDLTELPQSAGYVVGSIAVHAAPQPAPADTSAQAGAGGQNSSNMSNTGGGETSGGSAGTEGGARRQPGKSNEQTEGGYGRSETAKRDRSLYL